MFTLPSDIYHRCHYFSVSVKEKTSSVCPSVKVDICIQVPRRYHAKVEQNELFLLISFQTTMPFLLTTFTSPLIIWYSPTQLNENGHYRENRSNTDQSVFFYFICSTWFFLFLLKVASDPSACILVVHFFVGCGFFWDTQIQDFLKLLAWLDSLANITNQHSTYNDLL